MKMNLDRVKKALSKNVVYFETIDSTSLYLKRLISLGATPPDLVIAQEQTNGQGRVGKSFYSPSSTGLYLTFSYPSSQISCQDLTPRIALAVARAIDRVFLCKTDLKWVNDIYLDDRKISGILCQSLPSFYLIGIGINVEKPDYIPTELLTRFGYVSEGCVASDYEALIIALSQEVDFVLSQEEDQVLSEYRERCNHIGRVVLIEYDSSQISGRCVGIDEDFSLLVEVDGKVQAFRSGYMTLCIEKDKIH